VSENRALRGIFGPEEEVAGGWRTLHNEELHNVYSSAHVIEVMKSSGMRWAVHVARMEGMRNTYKTSAGKLEGGGGERPLRKPKNEEECKVGYNGREWINLA
jgi:hypothetical protein